MELNDYLLILIVDHGKRDYDELSLLSRQLLVAERGGEYTHDAMRVWFSEQVPRILECADLMERERMADTEREMRRA